MKIKNTILTRARENVARLERETKEAFARKQTLDKQMKAATQVHERLTIQGVRVGNILRGRSNLAEFPLDTKILESPGNPTYSLEQQVQAAHSEYSESAFALQKARTDLTRLEQRIREAKELAACFGEID